MNFIPPNVSLVITVVSISVYFIFSFFDGRRVNDEREELIRLKTFELVQKLTMWALTAFAIAISLQPQMPAFYAVMALVLANMYGEIAAKIFFRMKL